MSKNVSTISAKATLKNEGFLSKLSSTLTTRRAPPPEQTEIKSSLKWHKTSDVKERIKTATGTIAVYADMSEEEVQELRDSVAFIPTLEEAQNMELQEPDVASTVIAEAATVAVKTVGESDVPNPSTMYIAIDDYLPKADDEIPLISGQKVEVLEFSPTSAKRPRVESEDGVELLDNSAAKHKMAIRPRKKHPDPRSRKVQEKKEEKGGEERWFVKDCESENKGMVPSDMLAIAPSVSAFATSLKRSLQEMSAEESLEVKRKLTKEMKEIKTSKIRKSTSRLLGPSPEDEARAKRTATIRELIETEEEFAKDLQFVMENYFSLCEKSSTPKFVQDNKTALFGNFNKIAEFHQNVLIEGVKYHAEVPNLIGKTFLRLERDFDMHSEYCTNEPLADRLLEDNPKIKDFFDEFSEKISDEKQLEEHLKLPIQRLNDYQLLLKEIIKFSNRLGDETGDLERAHDLMQTIPQRATDAKFLASIEGFKGNLFKLGRLIRHDWFSVSEVGHKTRDRYLFLFKARILITKVKRIGDDRSIFVLKDIIRLPETSLRGLERPRVLEFQHIEPQNHPNYPIVVESRNQETRDAWLEIVQEHVIDTASVDDLLFDDEIRVVSEEGDDQPGHISPVAEGEDLIEDLPEDFVQTDQVVPESATAPEVVQESKPLERLIPIELEDKLKDKPEGESSKRTLEKEQGDSPEKKTHSPPPKRRVTSPVESPQEPKPTQDKPVLVEAKPTVDKEPPKTLEQTESVPTAEAPKDQTVTENLEELPEKLEPEAPKLPESPSKRPIEEDKEVDSKDSSPPHKKRVPEKVEESTDSKVPERKEEAYKLEQEESKLEQVEITAVKAEEKVAERKEDKPLGSKEEGTQKVLEPSEEHPRTSKATSSLASSSTKTPKVQSKESVLTSSELSHTEKKDSDSKAKKEDSLLSGGFADPLKGDLAEKEDSKAVKVDTVVSLKEEAKEVSDKKLDKKLSLTEAQKDEDKKPTKKAEDQQKQKTKDSKEVKLDTKESQKKESLKTEPDRKEDKEEPKKKVSKTENKEPEKEVSKPTTKVTDSKEDKEPYKKTSKTEKKDSIKEKEPEKDLAKPLATQVTEKKVSKTEEKELIKEKEPSKDLSKPTTKVTESKEDKEVEKKVSKTEKKDPIKEKEPEKEISKPETKVTESKDEKDSKKKVSKTEEKDLIKEKEPEKELSKPPATKVSESQEDKEPKKKVSKTEEKELVKEKEPEKDISKPATKVTESKEDKEPIKKVSKTEKKDSIKEKEPEKDLTKPPTTQVTEKKVSKTEEKELIKEKEPSKSISKPATKVTESKEDKEVEKKVSKPEKKDSIKEKEPKKEVSKPDTKVIESKDEKDSKKKVSKTEEKDLVKEKEPEKDLAKPPATQVTEKKVSKTEEKELIKERESSQDLSKPTTKVTESKEDKEVDKKSLKKEQEVIEKKQKEEAKKTVQEKDIKKDNMDKTQGIVGLVDERPESEGRHAHTSVAAAWRAPPTGPKPVFKRSLSGDVVEPSDNASFVCEVEHSEAYYLTWLRDNKPLDDKLADRILQEDDGDKHVLRLMHCKIEDSGIYTAKATDNKGISATCSAQLLVQKFTPEEREARIKDKKPFFLVKMLPTEVIENTKLSYAVHVKGDPMPKVTFYKNTNPLKEDDRVSIRKDGDHGKYELLINHVRTDDAGVYKCVAMNTHGTAECEANMTVAEEQKAMENLTGKGSLLEKGEKADFKWFRDGVEFDPVERFNVMFKDEEDTLALVFQNVTPDDAGIYTCVASTSCGKISCSAELTVEGSVKRLMKDPAPPKFEEELSDIYVATAGTAMLECRISGYPQPDLVWKKNAMEMKIGGRIKQMWEDDENVTLIIKNISEGDKGYYSLTAKNELGEADSSCKVFIRCIPKFRKFEKMVGCSLGKPLTCVIEVDGEPMPELQWMKDGREIVPSDRIKLESAGGGKFTLKIDSVNPEDCGSYSVVATNDMGQRAEQFEIQADTPPEITRALDAEIEKKAGNDHTFEVRANGTPAPEATWFLNGKELSTDNPKYRMSRDGQFYMLRVKDITRLDRGTYKIVLKNQNGTAQCEGNLLVRGPPEFKKPLADACAKEGSKDVKLFVEWDANPRPTVKWTFNDKTIHEETEGFVVKSTDTTSLLTIKLASEEFVGKYTITASNEYGDRSSSAKFRLHEPPRLIQGLEDVEFLEDTKCVYKCQVYGMPLPDIRWTKDGKKWSADERRVITKKEGEEIYMLVFEEAKTEDSAHYEALLSNVEGKVTTDGSIIVNTPPHITGSNFKEGKTFIAMHKFVLEVQATAVPEAEATWYCNGKELKEEEDSVKFSFDGKAYRMERIGSDPEQSGEYKCKLKNKIKEAEETGNVNIIEKESRVRQPLKNVYVKEKSDGKIQCQIVGDPIPTVEWFRNGKAIKPDDPRIVITEDRDKRMHYLTFKDVEEEDKSTFTLKAKNQHGECETSCEMAIYVVPKAGELQDTVVDFGSDLFLHVNIHAIPPPEMTWFKNGKKLDESDRVLYLRDETAEVYSLQIKSVVLDDDATYSYTGKNDVGEAKGQSIVKIHTEKPTIVTHLEDMDICLEDEVTFTIKCAGLPPPDVEWKNKKNVVNTADRYTTQHLEEEVHTITLKDLVLEDYGTITATAKNLVGEAVSTAELTQKKLPCEVLEGLENITKGVEGDDVTLTVTIKGSPRPDFVWTKDGDVVENSANFKIAFKKVNYCEATISLTIVESAAINSGQYRLRFFNELNEAQTETALVVRAERRKPNIRNVPEDISVTEFEPAMFRCKITGSPKPEVQWLKDGRVVRPTDILNNGMTAKGEYYLEFKNTTLEDSGKYTIVATNDEGRAECEFHLEVKPSPSKPKFIEGLKATNVITGYPCRMEVQLAGHPLPKVTWKKNGKPIEIDGNKIKEIITEDGRVILQIACANDNDQGEYSVVASNDLGENSSSATLSVLDHQRRDGQPDGRPKFSEGLKDATYDEGKTIRLPVGIRGGPVPDMKWYKDGKELKLGDRVFFTYDGDKSYLEIKPCVGADSGKYKCVLQNPSGSVESECLVTIRKCFESPSFTYTYPNQQQVPGRDVKFSIKVDGVPKPEMSWFFNGKPISPDGEKYRLRKEADGWTLFVKDTTYSDSGSYKVVATNKEGSAEHAADLLVADEVDPNRKSEAPTILKAIGDQELYEGYTAKFKAVVAGRPQPEYEWYRNGMKLFPSNRIIIERDGEGIIRLTIHQITEDDSGVYELKVWNDFGKDACKGKLICECISKQTKRPVGDEYKGFDKVRLSGVPIPLPDKPIISAMSERRCTLSWNPYLPAGPTTPVTYQVEMCECPEGDWYTARTGIRGCSVDLTNLAPKSDYRFRVRVENRFGVSEPSPYVTTFRNRLEREPLSHEPYIEPTLDMPSDGPFVPTGFKIDRDGKGNFSAPPRFLRLDHDTQYGMKNFGARIKWVVYGYPTPKLKLFFKDQEITFGKNSKYTHKHELSGEVYLFLDKLTEDDVGWYKCVAVNEYGESQQRIRLGLSEYPRVIQHLQETHIRAQNSGRIYCRISAYPPCDVKWFKDWQEIKPSLKMKPQFIEPDLYCLNFNGMHVKDAGLYSMAAVNVAGAASSSCMVHVLDDEPIFNWLAYGRGKHIGINTRRGTLENHYDIGDELGRGTQGVTYHCVERVSGNNFAAKSMWGKDQFKEWMKLEYEMMNLVNSSRRIVRLYDAYEGPKNMVLVMDLCSGGELLQSLSQKQYITEYEVAYYIRQVLEGLDYMHDRWIAHLGLNIGDLMVTRPNGTEIKIGDLSLARNIRLNKLQPLEYGMPEFVAPEVVKGENVSYPADMWALGIITYILLSGTSPFRGENDRETLTRIKKGELCFDIDAFKNLSEEAKDFVGKLLQYKPENRLDVKSALAHPWMKFSEITPHNAYKINTDRLRTYSAKYRDWYINASCRRWYRRRPLESAFTHPSKMVYPPGEVYTPPESPERDVVPAKPDDFTIPHRDLSYEIGVIKSDSRYQQGPDTYLLQLRDTDFPVRLRKYMNLARERSPIAMFTGRDTSYDYERVPVVHERRRFTDIMDEEIDDERRRTRIDKYTSGFVRSKQMTSSLDLPKRVKYEIPSRYTIRDEAEAIKLEEREKGKGPFIREKPPSTAITEGMALTLTCVVTGEPEPVTQWFRNDIILGDTPRMVITNTGGRSQLYIKECKDFDVGFYKVVARNSIAQATHRFRLIKGEIPGMCDPPELQQVSGTQVLLKWRTPIDDGGASIEIYHLQMKPVGEVVWTTLTDCQAQELYLVEGLEPHKAYQFRVAAKNIRGWGEFSISTPAIRTASKESPAVQMPVEQQLQQKHPKLQVLQLPGARGEIRDLLDYGREVQHVPLKGGEGAMLQMKKYKMAYEISRGRFSSVMRCVRHDDQRTFTCKIFLRKGREEAVKKEYEMAKSLRHERLAAMYEAYDLPEVTTFIMEYLGGPDIITFLSNKLQYTEQNVSTVINQVLDAVSYLHWRGICHLDIQPDNIVVTSPNKIDVKLVDFGSSQTVSRGGTDVEVNGLLDYIAPEVLYDKKAFPNSDVWSIGVLTYTLLTGTSPFIGHNEEETLTNIQCVRFKFETLGELVSQEATRFIMLIFKRDPSKRPTEEECIDHKWLGENDFMVKKRERSLLSTTRLREYGGQYHKQRKDQASNSPAFSSFLQEC